MKNTTKRVSNEQILQAILGLTEAIKAQVAAPAPVVETPEVSQESTQIPKVDEDYLANRKVAAQAHANKVGGTVVLYARRNLRGETKLAFAQEGRFTTLRDKGLIGAVATYQPE